MANCVGLGLHPGIITLFLPSEELPISKACLLHVGKEWTFGVHWILVKAR